MENPLPWRQEEMSSQELRRQLEALQDAVSSPQLFESWLGKTRWKQGEIHGLILENDGKPWGNLANIGKRNHEI